MTTTAPPGKTLWIVLLLRCKQCQRPMGRLLEDADGNQGWLTTRLHDPCRCGRSLPDPVKLQSRIAREQRRGQHPVLFEGPGRVAAAPFQIWF
jgi:hypothetical protein